MFHVEHLGIRPPQLIALPCGISRFGTLQPANSLPAAPCRHRRRSGGGTVPRGFASTRLRAKVGAPPGTGHGRPGGDSRPARADLTAPQMPWWAHSGPGVTISGVPIVPGARPVPPDPFPWVALAGPAAIRGPPKGVGSRNGRLARAGPEACHGTPALHPVHPGRRTSLVACRPFAPEAPAPRAPSHPGLSRRTATITGRGGRVFESVPRGTPALLSRFRPRCV